LLEPRQPEPGNVADVIFERKMHKNASAAGAMVRSRLAELKRWTNGRLGYDEEPTGGAYSLD